MSEEESFRPAREIEAELEGKELYREITKSLQEISEADGSLHPNDEQHRYSIFAGDNEDEKRNADLYLDATVYQAGPGRRGLSLDLERLPAKRSLQPHFEVASAKNGAAERILPFKVVLINLTPSESQLNIGLVVGNTPGESYNPKYQLGPDGGLQRVNDDKELHPSGHLRMNTEEMPLVLKATRSYLVRIKETLGEKIAREKARKEKFI